jgi:pimeloyl-ACP methyl ester carboxylesterase
MKREQAIIFPVGYYEFHKNQVYNFQLNRWHSLGLFKFEDIENIGKDIESFEDWKVKMVQLAEKALAENRILNAAFYYRAAEFYVLEGDEPGKEYYYDKFIDLFYRAVEGESFERISIPYDRGFLPALRIEPENRKMGTLLLHGGFDSFIEEWYPMMQYLAAKGYEVIGFEGPGQGNVLLKQGIPLDYQWEKPVKAILDHLELEEVSLLGLSMGGWFCLRAAAFEPRIKNVIASGHATDYSRIPPAFMRWLMMFFVNNFREYSRRSFFKIVAKGGIQSWQISNLSHVTKLPPLEAFEYSLNLNEENLHCEKVTQNVLYLTGRDDHFIPFKMHDRQLKLFTNVKSLTDRVFTKEEHAQNHCQIGNVKLLLDVIWDWLEDNK